MPGRTTRPLADPKKNPEDVADTGDTDLQTKQQAILDSFLSETEANRCIQTEQKADVDEMLASKSIYSPASQTRLIRSGGSLTSHEFPTQTGTSNGP